MYNKKTILKITWLIKTYLENIFYFSFLFDHLIIVNYCNMFNVIFYYTFTRLLLIILSILYLKKNVQ
jgi:hypothetical protein